MLRFVWRATHAGAPDNDDYARAADRLLLRTDSGETELQVFPKPDAEPPPATPALTKAVQDFVAARGTGRVVIMVHGYSWGQADFERAEFDEDPYRTLFALPEALPEPYRVMSWVPMVGADNAVGFAWTSDPGLWDYARACWSNPYEYAVQDLAPLAARALAVIVATFAAMGVQVDVLAHSLGTRVAVQALTLLAGMAGGAVAVRRAVMMGGAEYSLEALAAARRVKTDTYNLVIRGDRVLKWGAAQLGGSHRPANTMLSRVIGYDGVRRLPNWIDFQLDHRDEDNAEIFRSWFDRLGGYRLSGAPAAGRGVHWAYYLNLGNRELIADLLAKPAFTADWLRQAGAPDGVGRFRYDQLNGRPPKPLMTCRSRRSAWAR